MQIRKVTEDDIEYIAAMEQMIFTEPWSENVYRQTLKLPEVIYLLAEEEGRIIGLAGVRNIVGEGEITNVMVLPECRNRGVAGTILKELMSEGRNMGISDFTLEVRVSNAAAIRLYESLGFENVGIRPNFYSKPKEDAMIMRTGLQPL